ncbi:MAG TPA: thioesterase family protein [Gemmatimonadales bacterium]|nr:thioesterase family protein [Gemmatimonadales bacterium]
MAEDEVPAGVPSHDEPLTVQPGDIDALGHVNNTVYLRWVQDAAVAHWRARAPAAAQQQVLWVVLRHEIDYLRPALAGDALVARTWIGTAEGLSFERHTRIVRPADGRTLARARTLWCPVDAASGRPRRVSAALRDLFSHHATGEAAAGEMAP